jgi:hypothetical protein
VIEYIVIFLAGAVAGAIFHKAISAWFAKKHITLPEK